MCDDFWTLHIEDIVYDCMGCMYIVLWSKWLSIHWYYSVLTGRGGRGGGRGGSRGGGRGENCISCLYCPVMYV